MNEESNISVRDAVDRLERSLSTERNTSSRSSIDDFSVPGYLRTTASSNSKYREKRKMLQNNNDNKRRRFQNANTVVPTKNYDGNIHARQESRESSVFSIAATVREDPEDEHENQAQFEKLCLYAKYLQWVFLNRKAKIAFEHRKQAVERELVLGMEAVTEKRIREAKLFKEKNEMLDDRDVKKYIQQAQKVADKIKQKLARQNFDLAQEKKEMSIILANMNDLDIPMSSVHENIKELIKTRELIQRIIQRP